VLSLLQDLVQRPQFLLAAVRRSCSSLGPCSPDRSKLLCFGFPWQLLQTPFDSLAARPGLALLLLGLVHKSV
jgi:hypothetical protein